MKKSLYKSIKYINGILHWELIEELTDNTTNILAEGMAKTYQEMVNQIEPEWSKASSNNDYRVRRYGNHIDFRVDENIIEFLNNMSDRDWETIS